MTSRTGRSRDSGFYQMICAENLTKKFDDFLAVDGVNLQVFPGQVLVLLGPNGAGKTTTVRMLTSVLKPTRGRALVAGYDVEREAEQVRFNIGVLTEHHGLYARMNAQEYLEFFGKLYRLELKQIRRRAEELLHRFGLFEDRFRRLGEFSKGMRQKLALVRALLHDPPVLLLDEPTSAMDPESARAVRDAIASLRSGDRTIMLCTHNLSEAEELADQVAIIRRGRIILSDTLENIKQNVLGPAEFQATFSKSLDGWSADLPEGVVLTERGANWLRFRVQDPPGTNPELLRMLSARMEMVTFQELPRSLEKAYLEVMRRAVIEEGNLAQ